MMAQARILIHFCAVVLLFFVKTVIACFGLKRRVGGFAIKSELYYSPLGFYQFSF